VSAFGPTIIQSVAGGTEAAQQAARRDQAKKARSAEPRKRIIEDEVDLEITSTETPEAVRRLKGNEEEEASLDHKGHPQPQPRAKPDQPSLDVQG
jgi:hypothetical protein